MGCFQVMVYVGLVRQGCCKVLLRVALGLECISVGLFLVTMTLLRAGWRQLLVGLSEVSGSVMLRVGDRRSLHGLLWMGLGRKTMTLVRHWFRQRGVPLTMVSCQWRLLWVTLTLLRVWLAQDCSEMELSLERKDLVMGAT